MDVATLLDLWHGDQDAHGYQCVKLVIRACELERPDTQTAALRIFYPSPEDEPDRATLETIKAGYDLYQRRQKRRTRRGV